MAVEAPAESRGIYEPQPQTALSALKKDLREQAWNRRCDAAAIDVRKAATIEEGHEMLSRRSRLIGKAAGLTEAAELIEDMLYGPLPVGWNEEER